MKTKVDQKPDLVAQARRLREQTCALLGLDAKQLSPAQLVRVDRCSVLRLRLSDLEALQLNGRPFDTSEYIEASEALERLLGSDPEATTTHDFSGAREELAQLLAKRAAAIEHREVRESTRLREANARLQEEVVKLQAQLRAQPPQQQQPVKQADNVVSIDAARAAERAADERAWRNYTYGGGAVVAPAWSPPDHRR